MYFPARQRYLFFHKAKIRLVRHWTLKSVSWLQNCILIFVDENCKCQIILSAFLKSISIKFWDKYLFHKKKPLVLCFLRNCNCKWIINLFLHSSSVLSVSNLDLNYFNLDLTVLRILINMYMYIQCTIYIYCQKYEI